MSIHPSAIVHPGAEIDSTAEIGPLCVIGPRVKIGAHTRLLGHVVVDNRTTVGARNIIHPFACVGGAPQDKKFNNEPARLLIGDDNVIRESVTLNIGTEGGHMQTTVGNGCLFMAYSHVAHDCRIGNGVIVANGVALAGHVELHDHSILGGLAAIHQFCRVGRLAFVGGGAMVAQDVPPFCVAQGDRATLAGLNLVGLRRAGWTRATISDVHRTFGELFQPATGTRQQALESVRGALEDRAAEVTELCRFIGEASRGVCGARRPGQADGADG